MIWVFLDWKLVDEMRECIGSEIIIRILFSDIGSCANECRGKASMFIFQRNERCSSTGCKCFCEDTAKSDGTCDTTMNDSYDLYAYTGKYG